MPATIERVPPGRAQEQRDFGRECRREVPRSAHADWRARPERRISVQGVLAAVLPKAKRTTRQQALRAVDKARGRTNLGALKRFARRAARGSRVARSPRAGR